MNNGATQSLCGLSLSPFARDVLIERQRQILQEGFSPNHDAEHRGGELALAATCYADEAVTQICQPEREPCLTQLVPGWWPFEPSWWKPSLDARKNLVKATALLLAQGDAIDLQIDIEPGGSSPWLMFWRSTAPSAARRTPKSPRALQLMTRA